MKKIVIFTVAATLLVLSGCSKKQAAVTPAAENTEVADIEPTPAKAAAVDDGSTILDDAEEGVYWNAVLNDWAEWGNKLGETEFSEGVDTTDSWVDGQAIEFKFSEIPEGGVAHFYCTDIIENNWSDFNKLKLEVKNTSSSTVSLQFYTKSGDTWAWSDTDAIEIPSGTQSVEFDLSSRGVAHKEAILEMGFTLYGPSEAASLCIDNLRLE